MILVSPMHLKICLIQPQSTEHKKCYFNVYIYKEIFIKLDNI